MGCDIHLYVEKRVDGRWVSVDRQVTDDAGSDEEYRTVPYDERFYTGRNYDLFAILADVRNGIGFAGIKTGEGFVPIGQPKGIPDDADIVYKDEVEGWSSDGHSHSHFTVAELLAYDWTQTTKKEGVVGLRDLAHWKLDGEPKTYSAGVGGGDVKVFEGSEMIPLIDEILKELEPRFDGISWYSLFHMQTGLFGMTANTSPECVAIQAELVKRLDAKSPFYRVDWETPYYEAAGHFLSMTMPKLWHLGAPDDVRILFFFDN